MQNIKPWAMACMATVALTVVLGLVLGGNGTRLGVEADLPTIRHEDTNQLGDGNLVDVLSGVSTKERLAHVNWNGSVLTLELKVPAQGGRPETWFEDAKSYVNLSFGQLSNVKRLLLRITEEEARGGGSRLLAAMDVRAEDDWLANELDKLRLADPVHDEAWKKKLRLRLTSAWEDRFGPVSGYSATPRE